MLFFFATHKFCKDENGKAYYIPISKGEHNGVVYSFVFRDPMVSSTYDMITKFKSFDFIPPRRPLEQKCALYECDIYSINKVVTDIDTIFYLDSNFDTTGVATFEELFPDSNNDLFYKVLAELVSKNKDNYPLNKFVIYRDL